MQKIFDEVNSLDKRCYEEFGLSEDILMEHAALSMQLYIQENYSDKKTVLIACGCGNNGADGIALARLLHKRFNVSLYFYSKAKSQMAILQEKRAKALAIPIIEEVIPSDIIVDCIFGSGLNKALDDDAVLLINELNSLDAVKIACDIPSGISYDGQVSSCAFDADITITMGALKTSLFSDIAKDYVGKIKVSDLGIQREIYEITTNKYLLDKSDLKLPHRNKHNSHKGSYGHLNVIAGSKVGAGIIAAKAAFGFGAGIVSVLGRENLDLPYHIMQTDSISENCTAIAIGMGLGKYKVDEVRMILSKNTKKIVDADLFYDKLLIDFLDENIVLTPHPKEFVAFLKICDIADISIEELQNNRFKYVQMFCAKYPKSVLLLKGTNVIISQGDKIYINTFGSAVLSKGGSGDVLSGLVGSLLAQGYEPLEAAISASLAHAIAASNYKKNDFSLIPADLVEEVKRL